MLVNKIYFYKMRYLKILILMATLLITALFFSININAATVFPDNGTLQEQQDWVINNAERYDTNSPSQTKALLELYKTGKLNFNNDKHRQAVEKYLTGFKGATGIPISDRKLLNNFLNYNFPKIAIDLSKGQGISLTKDQTGTLFLVSSDGKQHNIVEYSKIPGLTKILSRDDGTIELVSGENSIHLKDATLQRDKFGNFIFSDGTSFNLKENFGKLFIEEKRISCLSIKCSLSTGLFEHKLNQDGILYIEGNKFSIVDGETKIGNNLLYGSYEFFTDKDRKKIDFSKNINLRTFQKKGQPILLNSFIQVNNEKYGLVEVGTISEKTISNVIACFDCTDFIKHVEQYSGYVDFNSIDSEQGIFNAEIKGIVNVKFEDDAEHFGINKNLLLTYENTDSINPVFRLKSCEGCREERVGSLKLNNAIFRINNEIENGEQGFSVKSLLSSVKTGERNFYIIDETSKVTDMYFVDANGPIMIEHIDQERLDEIISYNNRIIERETKANNICGKLSSEERNNCLAFAQNMITGKDGNIPVIGEYAPKENEKIIPLQPQGRFMVIRNPEIIKCIDEKKCDLQKIIDLGTLNNQIIAYENSEEFEKFVKSFIQSEGDVLVSLPDLPYAAGIAVARAGVRQGIRTIGNAALKHGLGSMEDALLIRSGRSAFSRLAYSGPLPKSVISEIPIKLIAGGDTIPRNYKEFTSTLANQLAGELDSSINIISTNQPYLRNGKQIQRGIVEITDAEGITQSKSLVIHLDKESGLKEVESLKKLAEEGYLPEPPIVYSKQYILDGEIREAIVITKERVLVRNIPDDPDAAREAFEAAIRSDNHLSDARKAELINEFDNWGSSPKGREGTYTKFQESAERPLGRSSATGCVTDCIIEGAPPRVFEVSSFRMLTPAVDEKRLAPSPGNFQKVQSLSGGETPVLVGVSDINKARQQFDDVINLRTQRGESDLDIFRAIYDAKTKTFTIFLAKDDTHRNVAKQVIPDFDSRSSMEHVLFMEYAIKWGEDPVAIIIPTGPQKSKSGIPNQALQSYLESDIIKSFFRVRDNIKIGGWEG